MLIERYIMSNMLDKLEKGLKVNTAMSGFLINILIALGAIMYQFGGSWSELALDLLNGLIVILSLTLIWYAYKSMKITKILKSNKKLLRQVHDERTKNNDLRSQSVAFITFYIVVGVYIFISGVGKFLFKNNYLFELSGYFVAMMLMVVVGLSHALSTLYFDKE